MNFITAHIYKPERVLFYIYPTQEEKDNFCIGILPEILKKYDGAFGTYDCPGLFRVLIDGELIEVLGIEFRPNDDRINYPTELESIKREKCFFVYALDTEDYILSPDLIDTSLEYIKNNISYMAIHRGVIIKNDCREVQFFTSNHQNRFLIPADANENHGFFRKIEPKNEREYQLFQVAYKDYITNHYNWNYLWPIIVGFGFKGIQDFSFVHFDIKDFTSLNVVYGHMKANDVLTRLVEHMNKQDWIYYSCRCHDDNFAMMIEDAPEEVQKERLLKFFDEISTMECDCHQKIYYRAGVVPMRNTILLSDRVADAGKQVQRMGNKSYETEILFFTDKMHDERDWASRIKTYLDTAIENNEFQVYFQPKYNIESEKLYGAEALIRWMYHGRKLLNPASFIPVFEKGGLISKLDDIVLHKVCQSIIEWQKKKLPIVPVSINLSRMRMGNPDLVNHLTEIVDSYKVDHSLIDFELTESAAYENQKMMISIIEELKKRGFKISMDDFGTGYSSLSLLTTMPMETIKIDKSFVDGIGIVREENKKCILLKNIVRMSKELNFICLAEGAETRAQIDRLKEYGCQIVQGFYYSKPLPKDAYEVLLKK